MSLTVSMDAFPLTLMTDVMEKRDVVVIADVTGAYLHAEMDDLVIMRIEGKEAEIVCSLIPEWKYDQCIVNADINGSQCTIYWYVDDNKISQADPKVVIDIISGIEEKFGKITVSRGNEHKFLGMNIS